MRKNGGLFSGAGHPLRVVGLVELGKLAVGVLELHVQDVRHARIFRLFQLELPMHQALKNGRPIRCIQSVHELHGNLAEFALVVRHGFFADQSTLVQVLLDGEQDLVGVDRLDQVIADFGADGFLHDVFLLALGDHDDRQMRPLVLDASERLQPVQAGHLLVQKNQVKDLSPELFERFNTAVYSRDVKPFALQEQQVRLQQINFVVGPKDAWSSLHE